MSRPVTSNTVRQFTVAPNDDGVRLDRWFKRHLPQIGFATISKWARTGQIRVDGGRAGSEWDALRLHHPARNGATTRGWQ